VLSLSATSSQLISSVLPQRGLIDRSNKYSGSVQGFSVKYTEGDNGGDGISEAMISKPDFVLLWVVGHTFLRFGAIVPNWDIFELGDYLQRSLPDQRDVFIS
jgi:hypothetical protein